MDNELIGGGTLQGRGRGKGDGPAVRGKDAGSDNHGAGIGATELYRVAGNAGCLHRLVEGDRNRLGGDDTAGVIGDGSTCHRGRQEIRHLEIKRACPESSRNRLGDTGKPVRRIGNSVGSHPKGKLPGYVSQWRLENNNKNALADCTGAVAVKFNDTIRIGRLNRGGTKLTRSVFDRFPRRGEAYQRF